MTFIKHHKHHFGAFIILISIAVVSGYFAFKTNITQNSINTTQTTVAYQTHNPDNITQETETKSTEQTATKELPTTRATSPTITTTSTFSTSTTISTSSHYLPITNDATTSSTTVLELMSKLQSENKLSFSGKEYSGMGFFVDEINGVKNDNLSGKYWIYYINGQSAQVGISNNVLKPNDLIEWKYENAKL